MSVLEAAADEGQVLSAGQPESETAAAVEAMASGDRVYTEAGGGDGGGVGNTARRTLQA